LKKKAAHIFLALLLGLTALSSTAQSWENEFDFHLTYTSLPKNDNLAVALHFMADNNGVSVLSLHFDVTYLAKLSLKTGKAGIPTLRYSVRLQDISGTTKFHDFSVDSLLVPDEVLAEIRIYHNQKLLDSLTQSIALNTEQILLPVAQPLPLSSLYVTFRIIRPVYTAKNYQRFIRTAGEMNRYYGYRQILRDLPRFLQKMNDVHPDASALFYNYLVLVRLCGQIDAYQFTRRLHLQNRDPLHFRRAYAAALRKKTRMQTLSEELLAETTSGKPMEKATFARLYAGLSERSLYLSKQYQPYIAGSFRSFARIFPDSPEFQIIQQTFRYFDKNDKPGQATTAQEIYKNFIDAASFYFRKKSFVNSMDLLTNAALFEKHFHEVKRISEFDSILTQARDGLASDYLKVALLSLQRHDSRLAKTYIKEAENSLRYRQNFPETTVATPCYKKTAVGFRELALLSLNQSRFYEALALLKNAKTACPGYAETDSLLTLTCHKLLESRLSETKKLLSQNQIVPAYDSLLLLTKDFRRICNPQPAMAEDSSLRRTAGLIFNRLVETARRQSGREDVRTVMGYLLKASVLAKKYALTTSNQTDSLIRVTVVPYILSLTEQANLDIWRRNFSRADSLYRQAVRYAENYRVEKNQTVKDSLDKLHSHMQQSGCRWKFEQARILLTQTRNAVKAGRLSEAESKFLKAEKLVHETRTCTQNPKISDSILLSYRRLFRFDHRYHEMTLALFKKGFAAVLPQYVQLDSLYRVWQIEKTTLPYTGLFDFVQNQHTDYITKAAANYFIHTQRYREALRYLLLANAPEKFEKEQRQTARGFAQQQMVPEKEFLENSTLSVFKKSYLKALETGAK
jgi:hypothetical protein